MGILCIQKESCSSFLVLLHSQNYIYICAIFACLRSILVSRIRKHYSKRLKNDQICHVILIFFMSNSFLSVYVCVFVKTIRILEFQREWSQSFSVIIVLKKDCCSSWGMYSKNDRGKSNLENKLTNEDARQLVMFKTLANIHRCNFWVLWKSRQPGKDFSRIAHYSMSLMPKPINRKLTLSTVYPTSSLTNFQHAIPPALPIIA